MDDTRQGGPNHLGTTRVIIGDRGEKGARLRKCDDNE